MTRYGLSHAEMPSGAGELQLCSRSRTASAADGYWLARIVWMHKAGRSVIDTYHSPFAGIWTRGTTVQAEQNAYTKTSSRRSIIGLIWSPVRLSDKRDEQ